MKPVDVLITYGWNRVAYNVLRSLSRQGLRVAVGDASSIAMAKSSRYCSASYCYRSFYQNPMGFIEDVIGIIKKTGAKVYLPMHEESFIVAKYRDMFKPTGVIIPLHDFNSLRTVHRKDLLMAYAKKCSIPIPLSFQPSSISDIKSIWNNLGKPAKVVIKAIHTNSAKGIVYVNSFKELEEQYCRMIKPMKNEVEQYPLIQEYVSGAGYGVSMLFNNGNLRARFTHRRLREKTFTGGTSTLRIGTHNTIIEDYAEKLLFPLKWHGIAMAEFKVDEENNKVWLIDVNPRMWGSLALAIHSGVDFPYLLYKMAIDGDVEPLLAYKEGVVARWFLGDLLALFSSIKHRQTFKGIAQFLKYKGEISDDWHWDDPLPFVAECGYYLKKFIQSGSTNPTDNALLNIDSI